MDCPLDDRQQRGLAYALTSAPDKPRLSVWPHRVAGMANFMTGTHHCPDCGKAQDGSRALEERRSDGTKIDWCVFRCASGHEWARSGRQAVK